jgi:protein SCO1
MARSRTWASALSFERMDQTCFNVSGSWPSLKFALTRASDGKEVTEADYRGRIVMLYFGYTYCPDICPTTLANMTKILKRLGPEAQHVRVLFVTVDPNRDTLPVLAAYVKNFAPQIEGLRGTPQELAAVGQRYHVVYSVTPATKNHPYQVSHSSWSYIFDASGAARLIVASLAVANPDIIGGTADDLRRIVEEKYRPSLLTRLRRLV